jgi:Ala-tRNA(Pro) deacylase
MAVTASVQEFLRHANVSYTVFPHVPAYTAAEEAAVTHTTGWRWAKSVVCFADGEPVQAVVPAHFIVDLERLRELAGAKTIRLAEEHELSWLFPDCERGAMPPFGPLYHQRVFVDSALACEPAIVFNAGTHRDAVRMHFADFIAITRPLIGVIGQPLA